jgi:hypothetical protein
MRSWANALAALLAVAACHHDAPATVTTPVAPPKIPSLADRMVALLPDGAQIVVELDLSRLRANAVLGELASSALAKLGADSHVPGLPVTVAGSPLASADELVLAAYAVGTEQASTVSLLATKTDVPGGVRLSPELVALGTDQWTGQLQARAALADQLTIPDELRQLRSHAQPQGTNGAVLRVTARLSFDARVALARMTGVETAPARISLWADVADDVAVVIDADAVDPGDKAAKDSSKRLAHTIRELLASLEDEPAVRALGVAPSLDGARLVAQGTWVRTIVAVGPRHLARVVERARGMLAAP